MQHKFPFVSLRIEMDGNDLDVNVHPAKREVRFARETEVYTAIYETVRKAVTHRELIPQVSVGKETPVSRAEQVKPGNVPEPFEVKRRQEMYGSKPAAATSTTFSQKASEDSVEESSFYNSKPFTKEEEEMFSGTLKEKNICRKHSRHRIRQIHRITLVFSIRRLPYSKHPMNPAESHSRNRVMLLFLYLPRQTPSPLNSPNNWNFLRNGFLHRNPEAATS